jgi:hypothetical protein
MVRLLLDPRFSTTSQLTQMVRSLTAVSGCALKMMANSRLDRLRFLG